MSENRPYFSRPHRGLFAASVILLVFALLFSAVDTYFMYFVKTGEFDHKCMICGRTPCDTRISYGLTPHYYCSRHSMSRADWARRQNVNAGRETLPWGELGAGAVFLILSLLFGYGVIRDRREAKRAAESQD